MAVPTITITGPVVDGSGVGLVSGSIEAELSQAASYSDGSRVTARVVGRIVNGVVSGLALAPNDALAPPGTHWRVRIAGVAPGGHRYAGEPELWQLASSPSSVAIGAVPRIDVPSAVVYGPDAQTLAARDAALAAQAAAEGAVVGAPLSGVWVGDSPPSTPVTRAQWLATGTGYWAWLDTSTASVSLAVPVLDASVEMVAPGLSNPWVGSYAFNHAGGLDVAKFYATAGITEDGSGLHFLQQSEPSAFYSRLTVVDPWTPGARTYRFRFTLTTTGNQHAFPLTLSQRPGVGSDTVAPSSNNLTVRLLLQAGGTNLYVQKTNEAGVDTTIAGPVVIATGVAYDAILTLTATTAVLRLVRVSDSVQMITSGTLTFGTNVQSLQPSNQWLISSEWVANVGAAGVITGAEFQVS